MTASGRKRGRPSRDDAVGDTARRILDTARRQFGEHGYEATTNRMVADEAGVTPTALYHYHPSKLDLYTAVLHDCRQRVAARFVEAMAGADTFVDKLGALLAATNDMRIEDPMLPRFLASARVDMRRRADLVVGVRQGQEWWLLMLGKLVDHGVSTGELAPERRDMTMAFVVTMLMGLTETAAVDPAMHALAIDACRAVLGNALILPPAEQRW